MREKKQQKIITLVPLVLCALLLLLTAAPANAASIPVRVRTTAQKGITVPSGQQYDIITAPADSGIPKIADVTIKDNGKGAIALPAYTAPGVYRYTVAMVPQSKTAGFDYDTRTFTLTVYVTNGKNGLETNATLTAAKHKTKIARLTFINRYQGAASGTPGKPRTGDTTNQVLPIAIMAIAAAVLAAVIAGQYRNKDEE